MLARTYVRKGNFHGRKSTGSRPNPKPSHRSCSRRISQPNPPTSSRPGHHPRDQGHWPGVHYVHEEEPRTRASSEECTRQATEMTTTRIHSMLSKSSSSDYPVARTLPKQPSFLISNMEYQSTKDDRIESLDVKEASDFISEFDTAIRRLEEREQVRNRGKSNLPVANSQSEDRLNIEECLVKAKLSTKQKQALFIMVLCFDADIPVAVFEKLCKSQTMKTICDKMFNDKSIKLLTEIA